MLDEKKICPICNGISQCVYEKLPGYIEGAVFDVYECSSCEATFVDPLKSDEKIYEYIYKNANMVPCYEGYQRYAQLAKESWNPLALLTNAEGIYWGVVEAVKLNFGKRKDISILDVGSGLGYLTYGLCKAGYGAIGLDISHEAVERATALYGAYYREGDLYELAKIGEEKYDCVLMLELIEHVEDPKALVGAALSVLKPGGKLIITTPNKTTAPKPVIWQSEFPPVHLWFLSERSMSVIAESFGKTCDFVDFSDYLRKFYTPGYQTELKNIISGLPRLTRDGEIYPGHGADLTKTKYLGAWGRYILSYIKRRLMKKTVSAKTTTMCTIITN